MYSHEIDAIIKENNYQLPSSVYLEISDTKKSPQIDHIKYDAWSHKFNMWTKDGYGWTFTVQKE